MFFFASKVLMFLFQPSSLAVALAVLGAWGLSRNRASRWARPALAAGLGWIAIAGLLPAGNVLILPLEERFGARPPQLKGEAVAGIILLGGFEDGWVSAGRGGLSVNEAAERLTEGLRLARQLPQARLVFTGGSGTLKRGPDAGGAVGAFLAEAGIDQGRLVIEANSRNTHENALFTRALVTPRAGETWVLVTSAYHMPRAMGTFRQAGFKVVAYPVDYRTRDWGDITRPFGSIGDGLQRADLAAKEWIGLIAYWAAGKSNDIFPAP